MSKIKYIHCFGTSYTAGGGFEWDTNDYIRKKMLETHYGHIDEPKHQYNFSWPGQLQKLLSNITVLNHAKQGTGNDRMYRKVYEIFNDILFNKDEHLFILEFSNFGRIEEFSNKLKKHVVVNYRHTGGKIEQLDMAKSYFYDTKDELSIIDELYESYKPYFELIFHERTEFQRLSRDTSFFLHWLNSNNLNVLFSSKPEIYNNIDSDIINKFECINYNKNIHYSNQNSIENFIYNYPIQIKKETELKYDDFHAGYQGNQLISKIVYNKLVDMNIITSAKYDIKQIISNLK